MTSRTHTYACCSQACKHSQCASLWQLHIQLTVILGLGKLLLLWLLPKHLAFTFNYCRSECAAKLHTQPDPKGTEGFILPSVTAQVITPHSRSDYKNYLIRDVHSNDVQSLNGVKTLLQEELEERPPTIFEIDVEFYRGNKQVWMRSDMMWKRFWVFREVRMCVMVHEKKHKEKE